MCVNVCAFEMRCQQFGSAPMLFCLASPISPIRPSDTYLCLVFANITLSTHKQLIDDVVNVSLLAKLTARAASHSTAIN